MTDHWIQFYVPLHRNDLMHISMRSFAHWDTKYSYSICYVSHRPFYTCVHCACSIHSNSVHSPVFRVFFADMQWHIHCYTTMHPIDCILHTAQSSVNTQKSYQCNAICNWGSHFENWKIKTKTKTLKCIRRLTAEELRVLTYQNLSLNRASYPVNDSYSSSGLIHNNVIWIEALFLVD